MRAATGRWDGDGWMVLARTLPAPVDDVWAALTEPARLERWIGTWAGDPQSGQVGFRMTAEGDEVPEQPTRIDECRPPHVLRVTTSGDEGAWHLRVVLREEDGGTALELGQQLTDPELAASVGPGWEYYLDRLVAAESGGDVAAVDFDDYYPALADHYRALVAGR